MWNRTVSSFPPLASAVPQPLCTRRVAHHPGSPSSRTSTFAHMPSRSSRSPGHPGTESSTPSPTCSASSKLPVRPDRLKADARKAVASNLARWTVEPGAWTLVLDTNVRAEEVRPDDNGAPVRGNIRGTIRNSPRCDGAVAGCGSCQRRETFDTPCTLLTRTHSRLAGSPPRRWRPSPPRASRLTARPCRNRMSSGPASISCTSTSPSSTRASSRSVA
jgi:hypothetical protein